MVLIATRTPDLRRSVLFVAGADLEAQSRALRARPDVLVQDLEDFTPPQLKEAARALSTELFLSARGQNIIPAVRINPLAGIGGLDLEAVVPARPELVFIPMCSDAAQVLTVSAELDRLESLNGIDPGEMEIVPNVETAAGLVNLKEIALASSRVRSCLLAAEDFATDLMAERSRGAMELAYARSRFLLECRAFGIEPIDAPYTFSDIEGCGKESIRSRALGYRSKSAVLAEHIEVIHRVLTPGDDDVTQATRVCRLFEEARLRGEDRVLVDGLWIEPPAYRNAKRLLERATGFAVLATSEESESGK